jgi:hypothetical protein
LILQLKLKEKTLEESHVKIKLLDSRMGNVKKQADRIAALEKGVADARAREVQFEEAIEGLNGDLRGPEAEVAKLRKAAKEGKGGGVVRDERSEGASLGARMEEVRVSEQVCPVIVVWVLTGRLRRYRGRCNSFGWRIQGFNFAVGNLMRGFISHFYRHQRLIRPRQSWNRKG